MLAQFIKFSFAMKIEKQNVTLPIINQDESSLESSYTKHSELFGGLSKRVLIVGSSGCGKTNLVVTLLTHPNGLRFENVYIYSKSLYQPKYEYLRKLLKPMKEIGFFEYNDGEDVLPAQEIRPNSIIIFDDVASCNQNIMRDYFCFGRHKNTDCFFLCQTYSSVEKRLIRDNANLIVIFHQDNTNLKHIYDDHVSVDMPLQSFKDLCSLCWKEPFGFAVIDKDCGIDKGRYRKGFDSYIML